MVYTEDHINENRQAISLEQKLKSSRGTGEAPQGGKRRISGVPRWEIVGEASGGEPEMGHFVSLVLVGSRDKK